MSGAPGPYKCQPATLENFRARFAIIHRTVRCATGLSGESAGHDYLVTLQSAKVVNSVTQKSEQQSQRGTILSGVAPDCPVLQEDKAPTVDRAPNPNGWVTWQRTGQATVPVRWRTGLSGAPIASNLGQRLPRWLGAINTESSLCPGTRSGCRLEEGE
jgi:hypothetical protein